MLQSLVNINNVIMKQGHTNQDSCIQTGKPVSLKYALVYRNTLKCTK